MNSTRKNQVARVLSAYLHLESKLEHAHTEAKHAAFPLHRGLRTEPSTQELAEYLGMTRQNVSLVLQDAVEHGMALRLGARRVAVLSKGFDAIEAAGFVYWRASGNDVEAAVRGLQVPVDTEAFADAIGGVTSQQLTRAAKRHGLSSPKNGHRCNGCGERTHYIVPASYPVGAPIKCISCQAEDWMHENPEADYSWRNSNPQWSHQTLVELLRRWLPVAKVELSRDPAGLHLAVGQYWDGEISGYVFFDLVTSEGKAA